MADTMPDADPQPELTGADLVIRSLVAHGIDTIFGYPGGAVLPIYDALFRQNSLRHILVRHEQAAVHAAEGYARSTGKVGAVLVTSGPGATNAVTGLMDAMMDSIPVLCLTGQVPSHLIGSDAFQEADTTGITRACTKYNYLITDIDRLQSTMFEAIHITRSGRPGPVVVDLPKDILNMPCLWDDSVRFNRRSYKYVREAPAAAVEQAVNMLAGAKRPVFYVGGGVVNAGDEACAALTRFVRETGYPCTTTLMGLGAFPGSDPQFLGMLGMHGSLEANMAMAECDVMLNIGARFDDRVTGRLDKFSPGSKKIHVDIDPSSVNKNVAVDLPLIGDAGVVTEQLAKAWKKVKSKPDTKAHKEWWAKIEGWRARKSFSYRQQEDGPIKPQYALDRLNALTRSPGRERYISTDVGQHQMWAAQFLTYDRPREWLTSGGLGTMGYGMPAIMGAQVAHPEALCVCVTGEASWMMNSQELSTIKQYRLPVKIFILNNRYMGMVRQWQQMFHGSRYSESYMDSLPDFQKLAGAYDIAGLVCDKPGEVDDVIREMIAIDGPVLVDMRVDQAENVYPMIPAGAAHNELVLGPEEESGAVLDKNRV